MATGNSNTYVLPSQGSSIAVSRTQFNSSLRAVLQNFYSTGAPGTDNLIDSGSAMGESDYDGMLFRNSTTGMLYISDSAISNPIRTNNPVGGKFTRYGIAWRQQASLAAAAANIATFDLGEAFVVLGPEVSAANNRIYLRVGLSTVFENDFVDLGKPAPGQVDATALSNYSISGVILANVLARPTTVTITPRAAFDSIANLQNSAATAAIEVKGSAVDNVCIGFTTATNSSIIKQVYSNAGISIESTNGNLAPIRSNVFLQATVTGSTSSQSVAPLIPAGVIVAWAGSSAPDGWLICNGTAISRTTYAALWNICSTTFGAGDNSTTFNIPNLQGRAIYGTSASIALGATSTAIGSSFSPTSSTTGSTAAGLTVTTSTTNSTTDKDVTNAITVVTGVTSVAHTHTTAGSLPGISLNYIIKT
jgi:microcystin-dependent protein